MGVPPPGFNFSKSAHFFSGDGEASYPLKDYKFDRLGVRLPFIVMSPWIPKGTVVSAPPEAQKPFSNSEYDLTSVIATTFVLSLNHDSIFFRRKLLGIQSGPLTKRDAWVATWEHIFSLSSPRTDCPLHLPDPHPPTPPMMYKIDFLVS